MWRSRSNTSVVLAICALVGAFLVGLATEGQAAEARPEGQDGIAVGDSRSPQNSPPSGRSPNRRQTGSQATYRYSRLRFTSPLSNSYCVASGRSSDRKFARSEIQWARLQRRENVRAHGVGACEGTPGVTLAATDTGPTTAAQEFWQVIKLPSPRLLVDPLEPLVGKRAFLEVIGPRGDAHHIPNPLGGPPIEVKVSSSFAIDWGDGTPVMPATSAGGRWPAGDLTHVYAASGTYHLTVTQHWSAIWSSGSEGGQLSGLFTRSERDLKVNQLQAVRRR